MKSSICSLIGSRRYRFLLKDQYNGAFYESVLGNLDDESILSFFMVAFTRFHIPDMVRIITDGYHYREAFVEVSSL